MFWLQIRFPEDVLRAGTRRGFRTNIRAIVRPLRVRIWCGIPNESFYSIKIENHLNSSLIISGNVRSRRNFFRNRAGIFECRHDWDNFLPTATQTTAWLCFSCTRKLAFGSDERSIVSESSPLEWSCSRCTPNDVRITERILWSNNLFHYPFAINLSYFWRF